MTWTPPPEGTPPRPVWYRDYGPLCAASCPWYSSECEHEYRPDDVEDVCIPITIEIRTQLACARRRAEAWHHAARKWRRFHRLAMQVSNELAPLHAERERRIAELEAIATAAREFVRLYGDGSYTPESVQPMFAALDRLRDAVRGEP
jgi:hypothetical protein